MRIAPDVSTVPSVRSASGVTRREFTAAAMGTLLTTTLLGRLFARDAFDERIKPITVQWLKDVNQLCADVKGQAIEQVAWQKQIETLLAKVELPELLAAVDFDRVTKEIDYPDQGERAIQFEFPKIEGLTLAYGKQLFALRKGHSVVPHGHDNMATAFCVLKGELRGRHYDRTDDGPKHMLLAPTIDRTFKPGDSSSISDKKDNVHWFLATTDTAFLFNLHVLGVDPKNPRTPDRVYVDPNGEVNPANGVIRAKRIKAEEAYQLYG